MTRLAREIVEQNLAISPNCAARTLAADIRPIVEIAQRTGLAIEVACFLGSSPIRQYTEGWELPKLLELTREAVGMATREGLPVMYVTEDTTRARPEDARALYTAAVEAGARRICIADTVGHATPEGARNLVRFLREVVDDMREDVAVDWHGHNDRGLGLANAIAAAEAGADRLHGTILGIGERVGNCALDQMLVNFELFGWSHWNLQPLSGLCDLVSRATGVAIPESYPVFGKDAYRTQTGVHAAAILKARAKGRRLARRPGLLGYPGGDGRPAAGSRGRSDERPGERHLLAAGTGDRELARPRPGDLPGRQGVDRGALRGTPARPLSAPPAVLSRRPPPARTPC